MPASHRLFEIATPALSMFFFGVAFSSFMAVGAGLLEIPVATLAAAITTIGGSLIIVYKNYREARRMLDQQERLNVANGNSDALTKKNERLNVIISRLCKRMRRLEAKIKVLEGTGGKAEKNLDGSQEVPSV